MSNNYAKSMPTVVLYVPNDNIDDMQVMTDDAKQALVFPDFQAASKYVSQNVEPYMFPYIKYANHEPVIGAGDVEDTSGKTCLKCGGSLFLADKQLVSRLEGVGDLAFDVFLCKTCDADKLRKVLQ